MIKNYKLWGWHSQSPATIWKRNGIKFWRPLLPKKETVYASIEFNSGFNYCRGLAVPSGNNIESYDYF